MPKTSRVTYPILPLRDIVVFPHMIVPLFVGRDKSVRALEQTMYDTDRTIVLVTQKNASLDDPQSEELYDIGTVGRVLQLLNLPDGTVKVLVEGVRRVRIRQFYAQGDFFEADIDNFEEDIEASVETEALLRTVLSQFEQYVKLNRKIPADILITVNQIDAPAQLADTVASYLSLKIVDKQELLEVNTLSGRLKKILEFIESEIGVMQVEKRIRSRVKRQMEKSQREYYLNEQMKAIQKELGENEEGKDEIGEFEDKIKRAEMTQEALDKCLSELRKLKTMNPMSAEATVVRNYLDWMVNIPWKSSSKRMKKDLSKAQKILDADHYGLDKVKERILEYLAVQARVGKVRGQILCLVGPPGVGKTSLGKSIAEATGRHFVRIALGGVRDESEIRGHRRTYIGSMPGKIIQGMRKAKSASPLFLLDEIDKLGSDWRGDPASALLEVLDPEQNATFNDHYLEVDYDLSDVMFVTTANTLKMPQPLLDRMEVIRLPGYTEDEKLNIANTYLIPKQMKLHGLKPAEFSISEDALVALLRHYTREAGVRNFEREIASLARKAVKEIILQKHKTIKVTAKNLEHYAGVQRYHYGCAELTDAVGITTGLAWTEVGGELLSVEAVVLPGKGKTMITGKLGDVMQESIQAAMSYTRSQAVKFGINPEMFEQKDIHIHVPEGAIPKDGPSAGIAMCTTIVSLLTGIPVSREVAMTGEITLRGHVLQIGGLKEKLLAAHRGGITTVLIPKDNAKDLPDIPDNVKKGLTIIPVSYIEDVLKYALVRPLVPLEWSEEPTTSVGAGPAEPSSAETVITH